jgi:hypothetical protein
MAAAPHAAHADRNDVTDAGPAVRALLDHLAEELAREYIRLMEAAAQADAPVLTSPPEEA